MRDIKLSSAPSTPPAISADARPAYEPPRVTRKKAVVRATLFTGGGGSSSAPPPLVATG
jgi:hypothetical protein